MNFLLSDEQEQLFDTVLRYAQEQGGGGAARRACDGESDTDPAFWAGLMELGVGGLALPDPHGAGLEMIDLALVAEALGRAAAPGPFVGHILAGLAIMLAGSDAQRAEWLPRIAAGAPVAALAIGSPDPAAWGLSVVEGTITGEVRDVPGAAAADLFVVGLAEGRFAIVPRGAGVATDAVDGADRTRRLGDLRLDGAAAVMLPGDGVADRIVDAALVLLAADAFGGASRCLAMAVDHARTREQFGQPIGLFQGVKFQLADLAVDVEPARGIYWYAAHAYDHVPDDRRRLAAAAKAHCADVYIRAARANIEAHGGIGYTWEHDAQIYFKRAMLDFAWLGTPALHRDRQARLNGW